MNTKRALRVANGFFILCGYQLHFYDTQANDFRISVLSVLVFLAYIVWYTLGVCKHLLEDVFALRLLEAVSPFFRESMKIHLFVGIKITLLMIIEAKSIAKASTRLSQVFGSAQSARITFSELLVYVVLFSNLLLNVILAIYDICMIQPKHFDVERVLLLSAVYTPHFSIACSLKYLCIVMEFIKQDLVTLLSELQMILARSDGKSMTSMITIQEPLSMTSLEMTTRRHFDPCPVDRSIDLTRIADRLKSIQLISTEFNKAIQKQLNVLVFLSALVLVDASYAFMYFDLVWHEVVLDNYRNAFLVTFACFYVFVGLDFLFLFVASYSLRMEKSKFMNYVDEQRRNSEWNGSIVRTLKDMKVTLKKLGLFKIFFVFDMDWQIFILGGCQILLGVGMITLFHYVKEQMKIMSLSN